MQVRCPFSPGKIASVLALIGVSTHAGAVLVADGKLGDGAVASAHGTAAAAMAEGYSTGWLIGFKDDKGNFIGNGQLWFGTDAALNQYIYFLLPTDYVDNTYGVNSSAGWGGTNGHKFSDLLDSASMGASPNFQWTDANAGGATNKARIDYISNCSSSLTAATDCQNTYRSAGVGTGTGTTEFTNGSSNKWGADFALTGSAASILEIATSLEYDLNKVTPVSSNPGVVTNSSLDPNWLKEVGYELKFAAGTFDANTWNNPNVILSSGNVTVPGALTLGDPHVSPPMATFGSFTPPCRLGPNGTCVAPAPGTAWLFGLAVAGMGWFAHRRRRRDTMGESPPPVQAGEPAST